VQRYVMWMAPVLVILVPSQAQGQRVVRSAACAFDTAAHTDTLSLEFSVRAFHGDDTLPNPALTRAFGDLIRTRFVPPATFRQLFFPNTYFAPDGSRRFSATLGVFQVAVVPDGSLRNVRWLAASPDSATDRALQQVFRTTDASHELQELAATLHWTTKEQVRLQFLARSDTALRAPIVRVHVPMIRIEQDSVLVSMPNNRTVLITPPRQYEEIPAPYSNAGLNPGVVVNEFGHASNADVRAVSVDFQGRVAFVRFSQAVVSGCPVRYRIRAPAEILRTTP
jgi:hypothetical protein